MSALTPLHSEVRGMFQDQGIDRVPAGYAYDLEDWIPDLQQANVRQRGAWTYQSTDSLGDDCSGLIHAPFSEGRSLLAFVNTDVRLIPYLSPGASSSVGTIPVSVWQNPVFHRDRVIVPMSDGSSKAKIITYDGATYTVADAPASALTGRFAEVWMDRVILACSDAEPTAVKASKPGDPTAAWNTLSQINTSRQVTGLVAVRSALLVLHAQSVERIRGTAWPDSDTTDEIGDLILEPLFDGVGCFSANSIARWGESAIFANQEGIWITDGTLPRNLAAQGGILGPYKQAVHDAIAVNEVFVTMAGGVYQDYYIITIGSTEATSYAAKTFVIHIPTRRSFMFTNIPATCYARSVSSAFGTSAGTSRAVASEELFAGTGTSSLQRVINLTPCFNPDNTIVQTDANSVDVLPKVTFGWNRMSKAAGLKRVRDVHVLYKADKATDADIFDVKYSKTPSPDSSAYATAGQLRTNTTLRRNRVAINRPVEGLSLKLEQIGSTKDARLFSIDAWVYAEEATRLKAS